MASAVFTATARCTVLSLLVTGCLQAPAASAPDILLIVLDTVRADHVGTYGYPRPTSPNLDAVAAAGLVYESAFATAPLTMPSMAALLTGRYGDRVGVSNHSRRDRLSGDATTLAEAARAADYRTVAVVSNPWLGRSRSGFEQGFERYVTRPLGDHDDRARSDAREVVDAALAELGPDTGRPLLLWAHFIDAHMPYQPPIRHARAMGNARGTSDVVAEFGKADADLQSLFYEREYTARQVVETVQLYDAAIRYVDEQIAKSSRPFNSMTRRSATSTSR
jgi:arylsulfatase